MTIVNLENLKKNNKVVKDICIVGAGTTGLFLANILISKGNSVVIIEAGNEKPQKYNIRDYIFKNKSSKDIINSKKKGLGGTSTVWGGQMIPFQKHDIEKRNYINLDSWPIKFNEIKKYSQYVANFLHFTFLNKYSKIFLKKNNFFFPNKIFCLRFSTYINTKYKNFFNLFKKKLNNENLCIYKNSKVYKIINDENNLVVKKIIAKTKNNKILEINAKEYILCAGAIESTKLLLSYNLNNHNFITKKKSPLGIYFSEQLSFICGEFITRDYKKFIKLFSPIYKNFLVHEPRLEISNEFQRKSKIPSAFCHFIYKYENVNLNLLSIITIIYNIIYFKFFKRVVWYRKPSKILLNINLEQSINYKNELYLNKNKYKSEKLIINWKIYKKDFMVVKLISKTFEKLWNKNKLDKIAQLKLNLPKKFDNKIKNLVKIAHHPIGSIRMGSKITKSVVDKNLKLWGIKNLYVCSTAVFPSSGSSNTGFNLLCLTRRLGIHITKKVKFNNYKI